MDSKVIKNYILLGTTEKLKFFLYLLIIILGDPISYRNGVIYIKIKPLELKIKK